MTLKWLPEDWAGLELQKKKKMKQRKALQKKSDCGILCKNISPLRSSRPRNLTWENSFLGAGKAWTPGQVHLPSGEAELIGSQHLG